MFFIRVIRENPRPISAVLLAAGIALGLTGGPSFYDTLLPGLLAWAAYRWITGETSRHGELPLLAGLAGALLISTGLGFRWNGWSGPGDGLLAWWEADICPSTRLLADMTIPTANTPTAILMTTIKVRPLLRHKSRQTFLYAVLIMVSFVQPRSSQSLHQ